MRSCPPRRGSRYEVFLLKPLHATGWRDSLDAVLFAGKDGRDRVYRVAANEPATVIRPSQQASKTEIDKDQLGHPSPDYAVAGSSET